MSDLTIQLLRLINEGKTLNEISEILNISHKKIFNYLTMLITLYSAYTETTLSLPMPK